MTEPNIRNPHRIGCKPICTFHAKAGNTVASAVILAAVSKTSGVMKRVETNGVEKR